MVGNCRDCIHFEPCYGWNKKFIDLRIKRQSVCEHFKNKADFVEVVRCKDCSIPHNKWTGCPKLNGLVPPPDFYCGNGKRK